MTVHIFGAGWARSETVEYFDCAPDSITKGNIAVTAIDGSVASGPGNSGFVGVPLATEGKVSSPKKPVGSDVPFTRSDI